MLLNYTKEHEIELLDRSYWVCGFFFPENAQTYPDGDHRKDLTPKQAYEMSLKFIERSEKMKSLLTMLTDCSGDLSSLREQLVNHLDKDNG